MSGPKVRAAVEPPRTMVINPRDGVQIAHRDWGQGRPVLFAARWAQYSDMWQYMMLDLNRRGFRCIAYDRRGHGASDDPGVGYDYDTLADDLAAVLDCLDLHDVTLVGNSMGCGEIVRYLSRHGERRARRAVLLAPTTPFLLKAPDNPDGLETGDYDAIRRRIGHDLPGLCWELIDGFFESGRFQVSGGMKSWTIDMILRCSLKAVHDMIATYGETDLRPDLGRISVPTLVIHGTRDNVVPIACARQTAALLRQGELKLYDDAPHGLVTTHHEEILRDLLAFIGA